VDNYENIINGLDDNKVIKLMNKLGASYYIDKEEYVIFPTICHNQDAQNSSMKLYYYKNTKLFYCYTECGCMSIFSLLKHYYKTRDIDYDWYNDVYLVAIDCSNFINDENNELRYNKNKKFHRRINLELPEYSPDVLKVFEKVYPPEWIEDNISKEAMDKYNILYSISQNKIIIPHYDIDGRLVGIRGRALNENDILMYGKYMPVKIEDKLYAHKLSLNLYGLYQNIENIKRNHYALLFEAE
jgi:hypothetical protein